MLLRRLASEHDAAPPKMASIQLLTLFALLTVVDWLSVTLGEQTVASSTDVQETPSAHALHHDRRANHHGHRLLQRSASAHHGNRYHGNQLRRGPTQPLHPHALAPDKPLVRRKRIRRDKSTSLVAGKEAHALEQAVASGHSTLSTAEMLPDKSKPKPVHAGKSHRRKLFRGRGRGRPLHNSLMSMEMAHRGNLGDRKRQRLIRRLGGTSSPSEHRHGQKARDQRPLVASGHHLMFRTRTGKMPISQTGKPRASTSSIPDSVVDEFHAHPLAVHRVGAVARRRPSASGSGARRRRLPVVHRSTGGLHHGAVGREVSQPLKHGITASRRRTSTPHIRSNDGKKKSSGGRTKRSRRTKKSSGPTSHQISQPLANRSTTRIRSSRPHLARMKRRRVIHR